MGQNVEINLPGKPVHGVRCLVIGIRDTPIGEVYINLKPLIDSKVGKQSLQMLKEVGVRAEDIKLLDEKQPEEALSITDYAMHAILDSGATRTIVPSADYLVEGTLHELDKTLSFKGYDKKGKVNVATHGGFISLMSNTGMIGRLLKAAIVLPGARRLLISMSQLDEYGCYVTMGGGGMRLRKGPDQSSFLALPRLDQDHADLYAQDRHRAC